MVHSSQAHALHSDISLSHTSTKPGSADDAATVTTEDATRSLGSFRRHSSSAGDWSSTRSMVSAGLGPKWRECNFQRYFGAPEDSDSIESETPEVVRLFAGYWTMHRVFRGAKFFSSRLEEKRLLSREEKAMHKTLRSWGLVLVENWPWEDPQVKVASEMSLLRRLSLRAFSDYTPIYVSHIARTEHCATVCVHPRSGALLVATNTRGRVRVSCRTVTGSLPGGSFAAKAVPIDSGWLECGDAPLTQAVFEHNLEHIASRFSTWNVEIADCPAVVAAARVEDCVAHVGSIHSFLAFEVGDVFASTKSPFSVSIEVRGGVVGSGAVVSRDARIWRIVKCCMPDLAESPSAFESDGLVRRWLVVLVARTLAQADRKRVMPSCLKPFDRIVPDLVAIFACDVAPNVLGHTHPGSDDNFVRLVGPQDDFIMTSDSTVASALTVDGTFGTLRRSHQDTTSTVTSTKQRPGFPPNWNRPSRLNAALPSCVVPGTSAIGCIATATVQFASGLYEPRWIFTV